MGNRMHAFEEIKGYPQIKAELAQLCDIMTNPAVYRRLGVSMPRGLLLSGEPGVGKTLMASCLIKETGWNAVVCKKNKPSGEFVNHIRACFEEAEKAAPCIILLDDLDKYANEDQQHDDAEEYVTVQACIDDAKEKKVFVVATVNEEYKLPNSLTRSGRFDRKIEVTIPSGDDAVDIVKAFLEKKEFISDVDAKAVAQLLDGRSCAELETIINDAGIRAGFERRDSISMDDIINAYLKASYNAGSIHKEELEESAVLAAYHEAGHATISECLTPGSVTLVSISASPSTGGITCCYDREPRYRTARSFRNYMMVSLAGRAAIEMVFGEMDCGDKYDIANAFDKADTLIAEIGLAGLDKMRIKWEDTQEHCAVIEKAKIVELEYCYQKVKDLMASNMDLLHGIARALLTKTTLLQADIQAIQMDLAKCAEREVA